MKGTSGKEDSETFSWGLSVRVSTGEEAEMDIAVALATTLRDAPEEASLSQPRFPASGRTLLALRNSSITSVRRLSWLCSSEATDH